MLSGTGRASRAAVWTRPEATPVRMRVLLVTATVLLLLPPGVGPALAAPDADTVLDLTFPVAGSDHHYTDTFEASRGGGRLHKGTDIMAPRGTPVHAAVGGTVGWITGLDGNPPSYGYMISIDGDDGLEHGYVHLGTQDGPPSAAYAPGIGPGTRVERGQLIGYVGNSGCGCVDHLHYDIEDPRLPSDDDHYDGFRYNPYSSLRAAELRGDVPGGTGVVGGTPITGDWDGDGTDDLGWWRDGATRLWLSDGTPYRQYAYGRPGDVPVVGDFDGDGTDTLSIIRGGEWHVNDAHAGGEATHRFVYGRIGPRGDDVPIIGDWDGDGTDDIGIIRHGEWHLRFSLSGGAAQHRFVYGRIGPRGDDVPVVDDWDGDDVDDIGVVRDGAWYLREDRSSGPATVTLRPGG